jgi:hypothetical protein
LVTVHRVQAQRRTLRALVTLQGSLSFLGYRDQRFPLSYPHLASISFGFYRLPGLLDYRVRPQIGPYDFCLPPSTADFLYLPEPAGFFLKPAHIEIAHYVLRLLLRDTYCACFPSPFPTAYGRCLVSHALSTVTHSKESLVKIRLAPANNALSVFKDARR